MTPARTAVIASALLACLLCVIAPIRATSGDAAAGRIGALVLRCGGGFDLDQYDQLQYEIARGHIYYALEDEVHEHTSVYGPAPAVVGMLAWLDVGQGDHIRERDLRVRARIVAAISIALAAALLAIAA